MALMSVGAPEKNRNSKRVGSGLGQPYQTLEERHLFSQSKAYDSLFESHESAQSARDVQPDSLHKLNNCLDLN